MLWIENKMENEQAEELLTEIKDAIDGKYFSYAIELFSQLKDEKSEKSLTLVKIQWEY